MAYQKYLPYSGATGWVVLTAMCLGAVKCATQQLPEGGPRDTAGPTLDTLKSSAPRSTNFTGQTLILRFDEWVELNDAANQIVFSPPFRQRPEVKLKGKGVVLRFRDSLASNTTYTIDFGEAIQDITERNKAKQLRYVFSTGPVIDSLHVQGSVVDASTGKPLAGISVLLWPAAGSDSAALGRWPSYYARTDAQGRYELRHLATGSYHLVAIQDDNRNLRFDPPAEAVAFYQSPALVVQQDTSPVPPLRLFRQIGPLQLEGADTKVPGRVSLLFNHTVTPDSVDIIPVPPFAPQQQQTISRAGQLVWHYDAPDTRGNVAVEVRHRTRPWADTVQWVLGEVSTARLQRAEGESLAAASNPIASQSGAQVGAKRFNAGGGSTPSGDGAKSNTLRVQNITLPAQQPDQPPRLEWSLPIKNVDTTRVQLTEDSITLITCKLQIDTVQPHVIGLQAVQRPGHRYALRLLPGALVAWQGVPHDTMLIRWQVAPAEAFGRILVRWEGLDSAAQYIVELADKADLLVARHIAKGSALSGAIWPLLRPGEYYFRVTTDLNLNGHWDTGHYLQRQQPEPVFQTPITKVRAGWDNELTISLQLPVAKSLKGKERQ